MIFFFLFLRKTRGQRKVRGHAKPHKNILRAGFASATHEHSGCLLTGIRSHMKSVRENTVYSHKTVLYLKPAVIVYFGHLRAAQQTIYTFTRCIITIMLL